jgi:hypothetical protein
MSTSRWSGRVAVVGIFCAFVAAGASSARAQGTSAAAITGVVKDGSGAVMPGVTVEAASPALIEKVRTAITDEQGKYQITELRPGTYTVTFSLPGFTTFTREGLELNSNFTATVNAELTVGAVSETVTVSGASPLVDVSNVTQQKVVTNELLDTVPTGKGTLSLIALMPAAAAPPGAQDVGGSKGETSVRISIHGAKQGDQRLMQDGMTYNMVVNPTGRTFFINPLAAQEVVVEAGSGGSAEYAAGGAQINLISKDGGNQFSGTVFTAATSHQLQSSNFDDDLKNQGLTSVNGVRKVYDVNFVVGGPIKRDKLWFNTAHRRWGREQRIANLYHDADLADWAFTPDLAKPVDAAEDLRSDNIRLTWAATKQQKVSFSYEYQDNDSLNQDGGLDAGTTAVEAAFRANAYCNQPAVTQGTWNWVASNKLLFDAGVSRFTSYQGIGYDTPCGGLHDQISVREQSIGFTYHGTSNRWKADNKQYVSRASVSFVTGSHNLKTGYNMLWSREANNYRERGIPGLPVQYTFNNGQPSSLTQWVTPRLDATQAQPNMGIFVQDQWRIDRLTLNLGLRYEYLRAYAPAVDEPAGFPSFQPVHYEQVDCLPCWHDVSPRAAGVFDLFGNGRTAIKASVGRYVESLNSVHAQTYGPALAIVLNTTRSWNDSFYPVGDPRRGNFFPDCDLANVNVSGECGALANQSFGQPTNNSAPEEGFMTGFGKRGYNWQASVGVDHELRPGVALQAGYYRRWFGNFTVEDNIRVTPADYDPYCITAPTDPRLGSISGSQICGLYDIKPEKFGQVFNVFGLAEKFGKESEVYNGFDLNMAARVGKAMLSGGWNLGNTFVAGSVTGVTFSKSNRCYVVDSPQQLYNCESQNPYQSRIRFNGSYQFPWDIQVAGVYQSLPGASYAANFTVGTAAIQPSLGRPLAGGTRNVTIDLLPRGANYIDERINQLDLRLTKFFRLGGRNKFQANVDIYNLFNGNNPLQVNQTYGTSWLKPSQVLDARFMKFSVQYDF